MKTKYLYISVAFLFTSIFFAKAQNYVTPLRSDITPPTPQSSAIMEVQSPQPDLATGAVNLEIPIYQITVGDFTLPISLNYHSNGIKVFDDPSPAGYGWSLMPALRATRTVLSRPDELYPFSGNPLEYYNPIGMSYMCSVNSKAQSFTFTERYDSEHDIINIGLPGKTITRVIDSSAEDLTFVGACDNEYSVESDNSLNTIVVTDPHGIKYYFGNIYESSYDCTGDLIRTGWPLFKIY